MKSEINDFVQFWTNTKIDINLLTVIKPHTGLNVGDGWEKTDIDEFDAALPPANFTEGQKLLRHLVAVPKIIAAEGVTCDLEAKLKAMLKNHYRSEWLEKFKVYAGKYFNWISATVATSSISAPPAPPPVLAPTPALTLSPLPTVVTPTTVPPATTVPLVTPTSVPTPVVSMPAILTALPLNVVELVKAVNGGNISAFNTASGAAANIIERMSPHLARPVDPAAPPSPNPASPHPGPVIPLCWKIAGGALAVFVVMAVLVPILLGLWSKPDEPVTRPVTAAETSYGTIRHEGEIRLVLDLPASAPTVVAPLPAPAATTPRGRDCQ